MESTVASDSEVEDLEKKPVQLDVLVLTDTVWQGIAILMVLLKGLPCLLALLLDFAIKLVSGCSASSRQELQTGSRATITRS